MSAITSVAAAPTPFERIAPPVLKPAAPLIGPESAPVTAPAAGAFSSVLDQAVGTVVNKQVEADAVTRRVLLGDGGSLHQSVIAMQEASLALSMMIEVRNKVIDSYQEIMRLPV